MHFKPSPWAAPQARLQIDLLSAAKIHMSVPLVLSGTLFQTIIFFVHVCPYTVYTHPIVADDWLTWWCYECTNLIIMTAYIPRLTNSVQSIHRTLAFRCRLSTYLSNIDPLYCRWICLYPFVSHNQLDPKVSCSENLWIMHTLGAMQEIQH